MPQEGSSGRPVTLKPIDYQKALVTCGAKYIPENFDVLWTRSIVVQCSLLWDHGAANTQANLLEISAPCLIPVHCHT